MLVVQVLVVLELIIAVFDKGAEGLVAAAAAAAVAGTVVVVVAVAIAEFALVFEPVLACD